MQVPFSTRSIRFAYQHWFVAVLLGVFCTLSIQYTIKSMANRSAINRWRDQLQHLFDDNIYQRYAYPNPPIMAILLEPIARLPALGGSLLWFYLKAGLAVLSIYWVFRLVESQNHPFPPWAKCLTILLSIRPIFGDLTHGNVNLFILFLVVAALFAFKRKHDFTSGVLLALAIACKVTPALFVPYFLRKRAWKTLAGCALGMALFVFLIPGWYLGNERNLTLLHSWIDQMVTPYVVKGTVTTEHQNQSLPGLLYRLATHSPSFLDEKCDPERYDNVCDLDPGIVKWIAKGAMIVFGILVLVSCRTPITERGAVPLRFLPPPRWGRVREGVICHSPEPPTLSLPHDEGRECNGTTVRGQSWRLAAEFSIIVLGMLLFSERTWKHHCVTLLLPFAVISYFLATMNSSRGMRFYLWGSLALAFLLMSSTSTTLIQSLDAKMAEVYGAYVWAYIVLLAALVVLLLRGKEWRAGLR
jgi:hypothetical protein